MPGEGQRQHDAEEDRNPHESADVEEVREPSSAVTKEKHDAAQPEPPEADEFGLPVKPPRRRQYSLEELDGPEEISKKVVEELRANGEVPAAGRGKVEGDGGAAARVELDTELKPDEPMVSEEKEEARTDMVEEKEANAPATPRRPSLDTRTAIEGFNPEPRSPKSPTAVTSPTSPKGKAPAVSEWSHQQLAPRQEEAEKPDDDEWQEMPAFATHRIYDDWGKVLAKEYDEADDGPAGYGMLGGAEKGYTRVQIDEDAQSATSMDENTAYLFKEQQASNTLYDEDEESRDMLSQMQMTKELLTESQRIAYVGVVRLSIASMMDSLALLDKNKHTKKAVDFATEALKMWGQKIMVRLYRHMEIGSAEQVMIEQLAEHGVVPCDLTPQLMANARVKNPNPETQSKPPSVSSPRPTNAADLRLSANNSPTPMSPAVELPPPTYQEHSAHELRIQDATEIEDAKNLDIDIRWTVLCDLFLLLIADGVYDARSRTLLERVGSALSVEWQEICRFEKRITDALEMQEQAEKENWNEDEHLAARKKSQRNKRLMVMGLCTVGGGLVIGLSAGLLAPVIGAGLAAGFTGVGIAGTGSFLGGTGAAALIGTGGTLIGGGIGLKGSDRRTGAVKTYEYKPLFNNKRVNLIVTVAGWTTGKVDDVRLPFSTVDPIMGDIYCVNWEPEMLRSTGATIQILGTEALTQTIQQILGATFLAALMAGLSAPIVLAKISYLIDNPWTVSLARADSTGLILADSLIDRNLGVRPITLVGFSLGSRVIFTCLKELARRGALGIVQNVYMFGSPVVAKTDEYIRARSVVSGRFVNGFATNDWILGYLFRATSGGIMRVAGLASVDVPGVENIDVTETVPGHMAYRGMMPTLLDKVGWQVESLEFSEIEDPDPDNHEKRQRELINEIEEARKQMDEQPEKKGFKAFFSRGGKKASQKKVWETYDERNTKVLEGDAQTSESLAQQANVLFDVEAIRREALALAIQHPEDLEEIKAHMSVREIESTLPALKVTTSASSGGAGSADVPRQTRSQHGGGSGESGSWLDRRNGEASRLSPHIDSSGGSGTRTSHDSSSARVPEVTARETSSLDGGTGRPAASREDPEAATPSFEPPERASRSELPLHNGTNHARSQHPSPTPSARVPRPPSWTQEPSWTPTPRFGALERSPVRSASSPMPAAGSHGKEKNPWAAGGRGAEERGDDAEFDGREEEVEMSFE